MSQPQHTGASNNQSVIEWHMLNKSRYVTLNTASIFIIRSGLYPLTVVKTKIQIQKGSTLYNGTIDATRKIYGAEGISGLYKGFWISSFQIVSRLIYFVTYETTREWLSNHNIHESHLRAIVSGTTASIVGQASVVPFDVISQHLMVLGQEKVNKPNQISSSGVGRRVVNSLNIDYIGKTRSQITKEIVKAIYRTEGPFGFYRGYFTSLALFAPSSALWWNFYQVYQDMFSCILPSNTSSLLVQSVAGTLSGFTGAVILNPVDTIRSRLQVSRKRGFLETSKKLWNEERYGIFKKGLSARCAQSTVFSLSIVLGYETIKRLSVTEEYKQIVTW